MVRQSPVESLECFVATYKDNKQVKQFVRFGLGRNVLPAIRKEYIIKTNLIGLRPSRGVIMMQFELSQAVDRMMNDPSIEACIACELQNDHAVERHRPDSGILKAEWREHGDFWRCTITTQQTSCATAAQVDLYDNGTLRTLVFLPCQLTVCKDEGFLCLSL